jgi:hypothetical protein
MNAATSTATARRGPSLKLAALLGLAALLAGAALYPYLSMLPYRPAAHPMPARLRAVLVAVQAGASCFLLGWAGLALGRPHGLDAPWLRARVYRRPRAAGAAPRWWLAAAAGVAVGLVVLGLSALGRPGAGHAPGLAAAWPWAWRGALASFYGGLVEEVECRLFLVGLLVWLLARFRHGLALPWMFVAAIVLAALLFGAGHLPAAFAAGLAGSPQAVARIVLLNVPVGLACGALFWKHGLEHAMLAHFCADLVLHVAAPLAGGL